MGRTYTVPRNVRGESRIFYIFTIKSFIATAIGGFIGFLISSVFSAFGLKTIAWVIIGICGLLGFGIGTLTIPDSKVVGKLRKAGGEPLSSILFRTITFGRKKKIYIYRNGGKK